METISGAVVSVRAETPNTVLRKRKQKKTVKLKKKGFLKGKEREREILPGFYNCLKSFGGPQTVKPSA